MVGVTIAGRCYGVDRRMADRAAHLTSLGKDRIALVERRGLLAVHFLASGVGTTATALPGEGRRAVELARGMKLVAIANTFPHGGPYAHETGTVIERRTRPLLATAMALGLASGCTTYRGSKQTAIAGGIVAAVGVATFYTALGPLDRPGGDGNRVILVASAGIVVGITGGLLGVGGLLGMYLHRDD